MELVTQVIVALVTIIVCVMALVSLLNYAIANNVSIVPMGSGRVGGGGLSSKEAQEDAARRFDQWCIKGLIAAGVTLAVGSPFAILAELLR